MRNFLYLQVIFIIFFVYRAVASDDMEDFPLDSESSNKEEEAQIPGDSK